MFPAVINVEFVPGEVLGCPFLDMAYSPVHVARCRLASEMQRDGSVSHHDERKSPKATTYLRRFIPRIRTVEHREACNR